MCYRCENKSCDCNCHFEDSGFCFKCQEFDYQVTLKQYEDRSDVLRKCPRCGMEQAKSKINWYLRYIYDISDVEAFFHVKSWSILCDGQTPDDFTREMFA